MNENPNDPRNLSDGPLAPAPQPAGNRVGDTLDDVTSTIRDFVSKVPETINKAVERALNVRDTTVLLRLSDQTSDSLDTSGLCWNISEPRGGGSVLIDEGIKTQAPLFERIQSKLSEIERLRDELRHSVSPEIQK